MLTKQERAAIAERLREYDKNSFCDFYEAVTNETVSSSTTAGEDAAVISDVMLDLCDTSNMVELPLDKDGEVIHVGDTLYDDEGIKIKVCGFLLHEDDGKILLDINANNGSVVMSANELTHKKPVTIASIIEQLRRVINKGYVSAWSNCELCDIADKLEKLGDSDD